MALAKMGCDVFAVCPASGHALMKTRAIRKTWHYGVLNPLKSLSAAIREMDPDILVPCDDRAVQHLHELHQLSVKHGDLKLTRLIKNSLGSPVGYPIVSTRYKLLELARDEGIKVPDTSLLTNQEDISAWQKQAHAFPWFLKADGTWGGCGVRMADTPQQASGYFEELSHLPGIASAVRRLLLNRDHYWLRSWWTGAKPSVIIQAQVAGRPANSAVFCWEGKIFGEICVEVVCSQGEKGPAMVVRVVKNDEMTSAAEKIARRLNLSGFFGLDFMIEDASGSAYLIEMNPRCTPLSHFQLGFGKDLIGALYAQLTGQQLREGTSNTKSDRIAYFPQALNCNRELLDSSYLDVPIDEPELMEALLHPWSGRSFVGRFVDRLKGLTAEKKELSACTFKAALTSNSVTASKV